MGTFLARPPRRVLTVVSALLLWSLCLTGPSAEASDISPTARAGEIWTGSVAWAGSGSLTLPDGTRFTDSSSFTAYRHPTGPTTRISGVWDVKLVYPPPALGGCYVRKEKVDGRGNVPATIEVTDDSPGHYTISAQALTNIDITITYTYGGGVLADGTVCSDMDNATSSSLGPFAYVNSYKNPRPAFRSGDHKTPSNHGSSTCVVATECTLSQSYKAYALVTTHWTLTAKTCSGYSHAYRLGGDDVAFVFNPCQTKALSGRISFLDEVQGTPKVCKFTFVNKSARQLCGGYKAVSRTQWAQVDWFMDTAARSDACGVWVVDHGRFRSPKIKPAHRAADGLAVSSLSVGKSISIRGKNGPVTIRC
jgi:hypothetical protein